MTATTPETQYPTPQAKALHGLIREKGLEKYALFFVAGEGSEFPNGLEESSGCVIDGEGRIYSFLAGWDPGKGQPTFTLWEQIEPQPDWLEDSEYRRARRRVGLAVTS